ncbi:hypothetical protein D9757_006887 [Collybiopsis confluens]|uniref:Uncharacterized protein n=1 Tax=Collybiopsis confluens TaxID=2823264 RepID=A0A8H5MAW6_9AGAR|nr:hypothetical protein D9757_006887 [Collybiopsis confluens]
MRYHMASHEPLREAPVTLFRLGTKRKLMATPEGYPDAVRAVKRRFNLPEGCVPTFQSQILFSNGSGPSFELDESAYSAVINDLDEIEVIITEAEAESSMKDDSVAARVSEKGKAKDVSDSLSKSAARAGSPDSPSDAQSCETLASTFSSSPTSKFEPEPKTHTKPAPPPPPASPPVATGSARTLDPRDLFNEGIDVEYASPKKKKNTGPPRSTVETPKAERPVVYDVDGDEPPTPQPSTSNSKPKSSSVAAAPFYEHVKNNSNGWDELQASDIQADEEFFTGSSTTTKTTHKRVEQKFQEDISVMVKKERFRPAQNISSRSAAAPAEPPLPDTSQNSFQLASSQVQPPDADADPRFKVTIYGLVGEEKAEFMTRKKHTIKKVLAGACKSFHIDPVHAKLQQIVEIPDEMTGELDSHFYDCNIAETVGMAGIDKDSTLRVVMKENEEFDVGEEGR